MQRGAGITLAEKLDIANQQAQKSGHQDRFRYILEKR